MCYPDLTPADWATLRSMARAGALSFGIAYLNKVKAGQRRFTEDHALEIHRLTHGRIPTWSVRPDLWAPMQYAPALMAAWPTSRRMERHHLALRHARGLAVPQVQQEQSRVLPHLGDVAAEPVQGQKGVAA